MTNDRQAYFAEYYRENGREIRKARRARYAEDPEFRKRCQERMRARREQKQSEGTSNLPAAGRELFMAIDGNRVACWTISTLAMKVGRTQQALNNWQRWGVLPETPLKTDGGIRLYTEEMIEVVRAAIYSRPGKRHMVRRDDRAFAKLVKQGWRALGLDWRRKYEHIA